MDRNNDIIASSPNIRCENEEEGKKRKISRKNTQREQREEGKQSKRSLSNIVYGEKLINQGAKTKIPTFKGANKDGCHDPCTYMPTHTMTFAKFHTDTKRRSDRNAHYCAHALSTYRTITHIFPHVYIYIYIYTRTYMYECVLSRCRKIKVQHTHKACSTRSSRSSSAYD